MLHTFPSVVELLAAGLGEKRVYVLIVDEMTGGRPEVSAQLLKSPNDRLAASLWLLDRELCRWRPIYCYCCLCDTRS